jgi:excinuclease UvrABC helicase subunit UvrB
VQKAIREGIESEIKARRTAAAVIRADEEQLDQGEIVKLLEEEMLQAAKNLEFERAAQLRDKLKEMKGAPTIKSGAGWAPDEPVEQTRIWQPRNKGRPGRRAAK